LASRQRPRVRRRHPLRAEARLGRVFPALIQLWRPAVFDIRATHGTDLALSDMRVEMAERVSASPMALPVHAPEAAAP
jgi:hypothetical protein